MKTVLVLTLTLLTTGCYSGGRWYDPFHYPIQKDLNAMGCAREVSAGTYKSMADCPVYKNCELMKKVDRSIYGFETDPLCAAPAAGAAAGWYRGDFPPGTPAPSRGYDPVPVVPISPRVIR